MYNNVSIFSSSDGDQFLGYLRVFYDRLFPFKTFYRWLSYGNGNITNNNNNNNNNCI